MHAAPQHHHTAGDTLWQQAQVRDVCRHRPAVHGEQRRKSALHTQHAAQAQLTKLEAPAVVGPTSSDQHTAHTVINLKMGQKQEPALEPQAAHV